MDLPGLAQRVDWRRVALGLPDHPLPIGALIDSAALLTTVGLVSPGRTS